MSDTTLYKYIFFSSSRGGMGFEPIYPLLGEYWSAIELVKREGAPINHYLKGTYLRNQKKMATI